MKTKIIKSLACGISVIGIIVGLLLGFNNLANADYKITDNVGIHSNMPSSKLIRVGIGTNNFSSYEWEKATIYGTGEFELYNNKTYINTYDNNNCINIYMVGKIFVLTDIDDNVIAKVSGPIKFKSDFGFIGICDLKRAGKDAIYRGTIELISSNKEGKFHIVNELEVEEYLKGVVPNEMPVSFGLEALKAQSVAARNYVLSPRVKASPHYDVVDSVASQVYFGANTEKELSDRAVYETYGIVALYDWDLILAQYSSTAGGYTESYQNAFSDPYTKHFPATPKPYLVGQPDNSEFEKLDTEEAAERFYKSKPRSYDVKSSYYRWTREWSAEELQNAIQSNIVAQSNAGFVKPAVKNGETIGKIVSIKVLKRGVSGKIMELEIITETSSYFVQKELVIRRLFTNNGKALPSANLVFEQKYDDDGNLVSVKAYGGGFGHGVGMSQYGAGYMCQQLKASFEEILKHYYTGISLGTVPVSVGTKEISQKFYSNEGKFNIVIDNKMKINYVDVIINGEDKRLYLNPENRYSKIDLSSNSVKGLNTISIKPVDKIKQIKVYVELVR